MKSISSVLLAQAMIPYIKVLIILVLLLVIDANVPFVLIVQCVTKYLRLSSFYFKGRGLMCGPMCSQYLLYPICWSLIISFNHEIHWYNINGSTDDSFSPNAKVIIIGHQWQRSHCFGSATCNRIFQA
jgi:hypothetical protein